MSIQFETKNKIAIGLVRIVVVVSTVAAATEIKHRNLPAQAQSPPIASPAPPAHEVYVFFSCVMPDVAARTRPIDAVTRLK